MKGCPYLCFCFFGGGGGGGVDNTPPQENFVKEIAVGLILAVF